MPYTDQTNLAIIATPSRVQKTRGFENIVANGTAYINLPVKGPYYRSLIVKVEHPSIIGEPTFATAITAWRIKVNGQILQEWDMSEWIAFQKFMGRSITASGGTGFLFIPFTDTTMRLTQAEQSLGLGTRGLDTLEVEVDVGGVTPTAISLYHADATILGESNPGPGQLIQTTKQRFGSVGVGVYEMDDLVTGRGPINKLIFKEDTAGAIEHIKLTFENAVILDVPFDALDELYRQDGARVPQAGYKVVDPVYLGYASHTYGIANSNFHKVELTVGTASNIEVQMLTIDERF